MKAAAVHWKANVARVLDPLWPVALDGANTLANVGTLGRGWEWASPPWPQQLVWWAVFLGVFGLEVVAAGNPVSWAVKRVRSRLSQS